MTSLHLPISCPVYHWYRACPTEISSPLQCSAIVCWESSWCPACSVSSPDFLSYPSLICLPSFWVAGCACWQLQTKSAWIASWPAAQIHLPSASQTLLACTTERPWTLATPFHPHTTWRTPWTSLASCPHDTRKLVSETWALQVCPSTCTPGLNILPPCQKSTGLRVGSYVAYLRGVVSPGISGRKAARGFWSKRPDISCRTCADNCPLQGQRRPLGTQSKTVVCRLKLVAKRCAFQLLLPYSLPKVCSSSPPSFRLLTLHSSGLPLAPADTQFTPHRANVTFELFSF